MPARIYPIRESVIEEKANLPDEILNIIPLIQPSLLHSIIDNGNDKELLRKVWSNSKSIGDLQFETPTNIASQEISSLVAKGLVEGSGRIFSLTQRGVRLLRESILNDEKSTFTKKASKKLISKNSYDFGDKILVKMANSETFGTKYIFISKKQFNKTATPKQIDCSDIQTKNEDGSTKQIKDYTEEELVKVLHLAKRIVEHSHNIIISSSQLNQVPVHRIKHFSELVMRELNLRSVSHD